MVAWLLAASIDTGDTFIEELIAGLEVTAIGMSVVFSVLILLFFIMVVIGRLFAEAPAAQPQAVPQVAAGAGDEAELAADVSADVSATEAPLPAGDFGAVAADELAGEQLVAVISAAVAAALDQEARAAEPAQRAGQPHSPVRAGWVLSGRIERLTARDRMPYSPRGR